MQNYKKRPKRYAPSIQRQTRSQSETRGPDEKTEAGILVQENYRTVKVDNTMKKKESASSIPSTPDKNISDFTSIQTHRGSVSGSGTGSGAGSPVTTCLQKLQIYVDKCKVEFEMGSNLSDTSKSVHNAQTPRSSPSLNRYREKRDKHKECEKSSYCGNRSDSLISTCSAASDCQSTFSASDIMLNMPGDSSTESVVRRKSAPTTCSVPRNSGTSLSNMTVQHFMAMTSDYFRSHGSWRLLMTYTGTWESKYFY